MAEIIIPGFAGQKDIKVAGITFDQACVLRATMQAEGYADKPSKAGLDKVIGVFATELNLDITAFFISDRSSTTAPPYARKKRALDADERIYSDAGNGVTQSLRRPPVPTARLAVLPESFPVR